MARRKATQQSDTSDGKPNWRRQKYFTADFCGYEGCANNADGYVADTRPTKGGEDRLWFGPVCIVCVRKWHPTLNPISLAELARQRNGASDLAVILDVEVGEVQKRLFKAGIDERGVPLGQGEPQPPRDVEGLPLHSAPVNREALGQVSQPAEVVAEVPPGAIIVTQPVHIPVPTLKSIYEEGAGFIASLQQFHIYDQAGMDLANTFVKEIKLKWQAVEKLRKQTTKPLRAKYKEAQAYFTPVLNLLAQCERILKTKITEGDERARQTQQNALHAAQTAFQQGDVAGVALATQQAVAAEVALPQGTSIRGRVRWEYADFSKLPADFWSWQPDANKVQAAIDAGYRDIPGLRIWEDPIVAVRTAP